MSDKHADYSPNRHEITVYYTLVQSANQYSCKECLHLQKHSQFQRNDNSFLKLASIIALRCQCIMQRFLKAVKMVILDNKSDIFFYQNSDRGYTLEPPH